MAQVSGNTLSALAAQVGTVNALIYTGLVGLLGLFARLWWKGQSDKEGSLVAAMTALTGTIKELSTEVRTNREVQVRHDSELAQHGKELAAIWKGENCMNPGCPMRPKN